MKQSYLLIGGIILSFLGFLDATYLTIVHYKNVLPPCSIAHGCEIVLTSKYAMLGPLPVALIGVLFYLTMIVLLGLTIQNYSSSEARSSHFIRTINPLLLVLSGVSIVVSILLVGLQAFVLHAFCQYCLTSEGINVLLFIAILLLSRFGEGLISSRQKSLQA